jgi:hypothetical protein
VHSVFGVNKLWWFKTQQLILGNGIAILLGDRASLAAKTFVLKKKYVFLNIGKS